MLCKKAVFKVLLLKVYTAFDFFLTLPCLFLTVTFQVLDDKQTYFENHHHQKKFFKENNLNHVSAVSQLYLFLLLILLLLLMLQGLCLSQNFLRD